MDWVWLGWFYVGEERILVEGSDRINDWVLFQFLDFHRPIFHSLRALPLCDLYEVKRITPNSVLTSALSSIAICFSILVLTEARSLRREVIEVIKMSSVLLRNFGCKSIWKCQLRIANFLTKKDSSNSIGRDGMCFLRALDSCSTFLWGNDCKKYRTFCQGNSFSSFSRIHEDLCKDFGVMSINMSSWKDGVISLMALCDGIQFCLFFKRADQTFSWRNRILWSFDVLQLFLIFLIQALLMLATECFPLIFEESEKWRVQDNDVEESTYEITSIEDTVPPGYWSSSTKRSISFSVKEVSESSSS